MAESPLELGMNFKGVVLKEFGTYEFQIFAMTHIWVELSLRPLILSISERQSVTDESDSEAFLHHFRALKLGGSTAQWGGWDG